jgi:cation:H+ antiporter
MLVDIIMLAASLAVILFSCVLFVNAVECLGKALKLNDGMVGSVLAAVGTALPETIIPVIAILFTAGASAHEVGIGAIAGAPFMLGTLAFFVTGCATVVLRLSGKRPLAMNASVSCISRDIVFFLIFYGVAVSTTFVRELVVLKAIIAIALLASYGLYLRWTMGSQCATTSETVEPLYMTRFLRLPTNLLWISVELAISLVIMVAGAHFFIKYVQVLAGAIGVTPLILSLIITPIATELPEKFNSVMWIGKKKDTLAVGNVTGAMVFQSCFPVVFGMLFTRWDLRGLTMLSAVLALSSALITLVWMRIAKRLSVYPLLLGGLFYGVFIWAVVAGMK